MNRSRREKLKGALELLHSAETTIDGVIDDEKDSMDNMPENLQSSDRYTAMENAVDALEDAVQSIQDATTNIDEAINS